MSRPAAGGKKSVTRRFVVMGKEASEVGANAGAKSPLVKSAPATRRALLQVLEPGPTVVNEVLPKRLSQRPVLAGHAFSLADLTRVLPDDIWMQILRLLDEAGLVKAERLSRAMFNLVGTIERPLLNPNLEPCFGQLVHCRKSLAAFESREPEINTVKRSDANELATNPTDFDPGDLHRGTGLRISAKVPSGMPPAQSKTYEAALATLAASQLSLHVQVRPGVEHAVIAALAYGKRWKLAVMSMAETVSPGFLAKLDQALPSRRPQRMLHLELRNTACLIGYQADSRSLVLTRLDVLPDPIGNLEPLQALLARANAISMLDIDLNWERTMPLLKSLATGSHDLKHLRLRHANNAVLPRLLANKAELLDLDLIEFDVHDTGLRLDDLLHSLPTVQTLSMSHLKLDASDARDGVPDLEKSALHSLCISFCALLVGGRWPTRTPGPEEKTGKYQALTRVLECAPRLRDLRLEGAMPADDIFIAQAFGRNPAARMLRIDSPHAADLQQALAGIREHRLQAKLEALEITVGFESALSQDDSDSREE